jgi:hypothetical protein
MEREEEIFLLTRVTVLKIERIEPIEREREH